MSSPVKTLPAYQLAQIAGQALVDVRTVKNFLQGKPVQPSTSARVCAAIKALGIEIKEGQS